MVAEGDFTFGLVAALGLVNFDIGLKDLSSSSCLVIFLAGFLAVDFALGFAFFTAGLGVDLAVLFFFGLLLGALVLAVFFELALAVVFLGLALVVVLATFFLAVVFFDFSSFLTFFFAVDLIKLSLPIYIPL